MFLMYTKGIHNEIGHPRLPHAQVPTQGKRQVAVASTGNAGASETALLVPQWIPPLRSFATLGNPQVHSASKSLEQTLELDPECT